MLVLFAHPAFQKSQAHRRLLEAIAELDHITVNGLYEEYPDFNIDVAREQQLLLAHDLIVFQHPLYWYSSPAILKEWLDLVLEFGFAYGENGTALCGKKLLTAISSGGGNEAYRPEGYNRFSIRQFLVPFEQTAVLCGMRYLPPFVAHGMHQDPDEEIMSEYAALYKSLIVALRDRTIDLDQAERHAYLNEAGDLIPKAGEEGTHA